MASMNLIMRWLQRTTMYRLMLYFMLALLAVAVVLSALDVLPYNPWNIALQAALFAGICWVVNQAIVRALGIPSNIESSFITGLILAAIVGPLVLPRDWLVLVVMAVAAIASKYLLVFRRSHIVNPAAFGAVVSAVALGYPASWWIGSQPLVAIILVGGLLVMAKIRRWHLIISFFGTYLGSLAFYSILIQGRGIGVTAGLLQNITLSGSLLFFAFVMLVEPLTAPQTKIRRTLFGIFVGAILFAFQRLVPITYSLELALVVGNIFARIINPDFRQAFMLKQKDFFSSTIGNFWFEPARRFVFAPGQFLEYTLPHKYPDARGVRRYFSIASSPTESEVLLTSRFSEPGSTFKQTLQTMKEGDEVIASKVAGDFTLPSDSSQKLAFIAGGIGITPFRSMAKYLLDMNQKRDIVMLYGVREEKDIVFRDVFEEVRTAFNMNTVYVVSQRIEENLIKKEIPDFADRLFYISGPEPMVQGLSKILIDMGVSRRQIKRDYFPGYTE